MNDIALRASRLLADRRIEEAVDLLRSQFDLEKALGHREEAGHICTLLASCLAAAGRDEEALAALLQAKEEDPSDPFIRLQIATFLVSIMKDPARALDELEPALDELAALPSSFHAAQGVLGTIYISLERRDEALRAFDEMTDPKILAVLPAAGCDFHLVTQFVERGVAVARSLRYLQTIEKKANREHDAATAKHASTLLRALTTTKGRP